MKYDKLDTLHLVFKRYSITIMKLIAAEPRRFNELRITIRNKRTLARRLSELIEYGLIEVVPQKVAERYANYYRITKKGQKVILDISKIT